MIEITENEARAALSVMANSNSVDAKTPMCAAFRARVKAQGIDLMLPSVEKLRAADEEQRRVLAEMQ